MQSSTLKKIVAGLAAFALVVGLIIFFLNKNKEPVKTAPVVPEAPKIIVKEIGRSVEGREISAHSYGSGKNHILFVGGIHGGYEWNTVTLANMLIDYLDKNPNIIPENITLTVIPSANPDGVYKITGKEGNVTLADIPKGKQMAPGRFNANDVDLNRNFDCKWQPKSTWQQKVVSAGTKPFSEPESVAIKDFIEKNKVRAVVFWHSQGNAVYGSECLEGALSETLDIMNVYSKSSGYAADPTYDAYETTGDADSWLAKIGIPAITVELRTHETVEWEQNLGGVLGIINYYKNK
jgi:predicted deacylase